MDFDFSSLAWQLFSNSVVIKHEEGYLQWFSSALEPWKHYEPVKKDFSDVKEKVVWLEQHDDEARRIAEQGTAFAREILSQDRTLEYMEALLNRYGEELCE